MAKVIDKNFVRGETPADHYCWIQIEGEPPFTAWGKEALRLNLLDVGDEFKPAFFLKKYS